MAPQGATFSIRLLQPQDLDDVKVGRLAQLCSISHQHNQQKHVMHNRSFGMLCYTLCCFHAA